MSTIIKDGKVINVEDATEEERKVEKTIVSAKAVIQRIEGLRKNAAQQGLTNKKMQKLATALRKSVDMIKVSL